MKKVYEAGASDTAVKEISQSPLRALTRSVLTTTPRKARLRKAHQLLDEDDVIYERLSIEN